MKFTGMMWWIDRWRKSTAYSNLTAEEQGIYRNLLDEAWLRGGLLPDDDRMLARVSSAGRRWKRLRAKVLKRFHKDESGNWHHVTLDLLLKRAHSNAEKVSKFRATRAKRGLHRE